MAIASPLTVRLGVALPIVQAPMAGASGVDLAVAVARAGGLGSLPAAMLTGDRAVEQVEEFRLAANAPVNLNFFCHRAPEVSRHELDGWTAAVARSTRNWASTAPLRERGRHGTPSTRTRAVSSNAAVRKWSASTSGSRTPGSWSGSAPTGAVVMSSATTVAEAVWLEAHGCDVVIAQGAEAGGHRGMFLTDDVAAQPGTIALVPRVVDAVDVPVIAAGGIADGRGVAAAFVLGASAAQIGTAYLLCPEALTTPVHRRALAGGSVDDTVADQRVHRSAGAGRRNRFVDEVGPLARQAPPFPTAAGAVAPLRQAAEAADQAISLRCGRVRPARRRRTSRPRT